MIGSSISARPRHARRKASTGAACAAAAVLMLLAPTARAQGLFSLFEPAPHRIERQLESAGYELRGPLVRRGDVYVADVVGQTGARERLVIDARTTRIVDRFPSVATRWRDDRFGDWRDRDDQDAWSDEPRPPQGLGPRPHDGAWSDSDEDSAPGPRPKPRDEIARGDPSAKPNVIYGEDGLNGPATSTVDVDKSKPKPHVAKKKPATVVPLAKVTPSVPPSSDGVVASPPPNPAAVVATPSPPAVESPKPVSPPAKVQVETPTQAVEAKLPVDAKPVAEAKPLVEPRPVIQTKAPVDAPDAAATKPVEAKPVAETNKPVAEAKAATPTPAAPRSVEKKLKAVNDVPVNPLD
jgi:hypothetical protein